MTNLFPADTARRRRVDWLAWFGTVALALLLRFTFFLGVGRDTVGKLADAYLLLTWVAVVLDLPNGGAPFAREHLDVGNPAGWRFGSVVDLDPGDPAGRTGNLPVGGGVNVRRLRQGGR